MLTLDHVVLPVRDAQATLTFYTEVMQLPLVAAHSGDDWGGYPWLMMIFGLSARQELVAVALDGAPAPDYRGVPIDARHYAMATDSARALDDWRARLDAADVDYWEEAHGDQRSIYFPDPDGVIFEITWPASTVDALDNSTAHAAVRLWLESKVPA